MVRAGLSCLLLVGLCAFASASRLRETAINLTDLRLRTDVPVDPHGKHGPKRVAGYFELNRTKSAEMFYFFFESRDKPKDDPVVLWMTGGPGCSSELAVFFENGPFKVNDDLSLSENEYGWDTRHNMIFVDQPIGTGYSYSKSSEDTVYDEVGVANDMLDFMLEFMAAHPELADNPFYVTGESYAGHYVPAVSHRIWKWNKEHKDKEINFKGLAIGNGLTDPAIQYGAYADYALENKLIDQTVHDRMVAAYPVCKYGIDMCNGHGWAYECKAALAYCQTAVFGQVLLASAGINVYDIRKRCIGPLCYPQFAKLAKYLEQNKVREALGVGEIRWSACDSKVHADMMGDWMLEYDSILPEMLDDGVEVMVYAGEKDLICNWLGNRRWVDAMQWEGATKWENADDFEWSVEGSGAGLVAEAGPLTFVKVYNAGHMVPMDQGQNALDMISRFTSGRSFQNDSVVGERYSDGLDEEVILPGRDVIAPEWRSSAGRLRAQIGNV